MRFDINVIERAAKSALEEEGSFGWSYGGWDIDCVPTAIIEMTTTIKRLEAEHDIEVYRIAKHAFVAGVPESGRPDREVAFDAWWDGFLAKRKRSYP